MNASPPDEKPGGSTDLSLEEFFALRTAYIVRHANYVDDEPVDPPACPVCDTGFFFNTCRLCGYTETTS